MNLKELIGTALLFLSSLAADYALLAMMVPKG